MESTWIECTQCESLPPELKEYSIKSCRMCGALDCDECLNEAGYCVSCSEKIDYSKEDAIPV